MTATEARPGTSASPGADVPRGNLAFCLFSSLQDTQPHPRVLPWDELVVRLTHHRVRTEKDGPGWSPAVYAPGATRGKAGIQAVTALVLDVDHQEPLWNLLDGLEYAAHTTWKHRANDPHPECEGRPDCPHWRIILPLSRPVLIAEWDAFRARARFWLCPNADEGAKDGPRFFWLPAAQPEAETDLQIAHGRWLDPDDLRAVPLELPDPPPVASSTKAGRGERPGDRFNREADWLSDILVGWTPVGMHGSNLYVRRPGKPGGWSATISERGDGVLYVFTSSAAPLEAGRHYTKFGAYCVLEHGDNFNAATKALAERYSMGPTKRRRRNADEPPEPPGDTDGTSTEESRPSRPLPRTDLGNAERLVKRHGQDLRYCHPWKTYLVWDAQRWRRDDTAEVMRRSKDTVRSIYVEAAACDDDDERSALAGWAKASESAQRLKAMAELARGEEGIPILPSDMDADPYLLNALNGTIDLRTGELLDHDRTNNITKLAPAVYESDADCPTFLTFLEEIQPDPAIRDFLQRMAGYGLTGDTSEQCLFFLHGGGANGKSTFLNVLHDLLGDYAKEAAPELLTTHGGDRHPTELADLFGARFVTSSEIDDGKRLAEALVKQLTGGDTIKARFMRTDFFQWVPTHKLFLAANHRPIIRGTDHAIWRRIHLIPFEVTIPPERRDKQLAVKLAKERAGILRWAVEGCQLWRRDGLQVPDAVRTATDVYRAEQDVFGDFLAEHCLVEPQAYALSSDLYSTYCKWAEGAGEKTVSQNQMGRALTERGFLRAREETGSRRRIWRGLRLLGTGEPRPTVAAAPPRTHSVAPDTSRRLFPDERAEASFKTFIPEIVSDVSGCVRSEEINDSEGPAAGTPVWRCRCGSYERAVYDDGGWKCDGCGATSPTCRFCRRAPAMDGAAGCSSCEGKGT